MGRRNFPGGPVVKNPPFNAGDTALIPGQGTKIPHAEGQLSPHATTTEPTCLNWRACMPQLERRLSAATREKPTHHNKEPVRHNERSHTLQRRSCMSQLRTDTAKNK